MGERIVRFSDLSGQMADATGGLVPLVVTDYPDADPDQRVRIEVTPDELEKIGKLSIAAVGLETEPTGEEENDPGSSCQSPSLPRSLLWLR